MRAARKAQSGRQRDDAGTRLGEWRECQAVALVGQPFDEALMDPADHGRLLPGSIEQGQVTSRIRVTWPSDVGLMSASMSRSDGDGSLATRKAAREVTSGENPIHASVSVTRRTTPSVSASSARAAPSVRLAASTELSTSTVLPPSHTSADVAVPGLGALPASPAPQ